MVGTEQPASDAGWLVIVMIIVMLFDNSAHICLF
jgi:hypothetical protein